MSPSRRSQVSLFLHQLPFLVWLVATVDAAVGPVHLAGVPHRSGHGGLRHARLSACPRSNSRVASTSGTASCSSSPSWRVIKGSLIVAWQVIDVRRQPGAAIIAVPLRVDDDVIMAHTAVTASLIPGSLIVDVDRENRTLFLHTIGVRSDADAEHQRRVVLSGGKPASRVPWARRKSCRSCAKIAESDADARHTAPRRRATGGPCCEHRPRRRHPRRLRRRRRAGADPSGHRPSILDRAVAPTCCSPRCSASSGADMVINHHTRSLPRCSSSPPSGCSARSPWPASSRGRRTRDDPRRRFSTRRARARPARRDPLPDRDDRTAPVADVPTRLHAATKPQVLGVLLIVAAFALSTRTWRPGLRHPDHPHPVRDAPLAAHMVGRAAYRNRTTDEENLFIDELHHSTEQPGSTGRSRDPRADRAQIPASRTYVCACGEAVPSAGSGVEVAVVEFACLAFFPSPLCEEGQAVQALVVAGHEHRLPGKSGRSEAAPETGSSTIVTRRAAGVRAGVDADHAADPEAGLGPQPHPARGIPLDDSRSRRGSSRATHSEGVVDARALSRPLLVDFAHARGTDHPDR